MEGIEMKNLETIESAYNATVNAYDHAYRNNKDYRSEFLLGYMDAIEYVLVQLGVEYKIDAFGHMTIEQEGN